MVAVPPESSMGHSRGGGRGQVWQVGSCHCRRGTDSVESTDQLMYLSIWKNIEKRGLI